MRTQCIGAALAAVVLVGLWLVQHGVAPIVGAADGDNAVPAGDKRLRPRAGVLLGTGTCAGRSCHGSIEPISQTRCDQNEYTLWLTRDKHQQACDVLLRPEAAA